MEAQPANWKQIPDLGITGSVEFARDGRAAAAKKRGE
jgi:hypothetical protein